MQGRELSLNIHAGSELSGRTDDDYVALIFRVGFGGFLSQSQLTANVSGEVFLCGFPAGISAAGVLRRIAVNMLAKLRNYRVLVLSAELRDIFQVYRLLQIYRKVERFKCCINVRWNRSTFIVR